MMRERTGIETGIDTLRGYPRRLASRRRHHAVLPANVTVSEPDAIAGVARLAHILTISWRRETAHGL